MSEKRFLVIEEFLQKAQLGNNYLVETDSVVNYATRTAHPFGKLDSKTERRKHSANLTACKAVRIPAGSTAWIPVNPGSPPGCNVKNGQVVSRVNGFVRKALHCARAPIKAQGN